MRAHNLMCLATRATEALGAGPEPGSAAGVMLGAINQSCIELGFIEKIVEQEGTGDGMLVYVIMAIRQRLEFAAESGEELARLIADGRAS